MNLIDSVRRIIHHWVPGKHLLAAASLCLLLSMLALIPEAEDADATPSTRTIVLGSSSQQEQGQGKSTELNRVLDATELAPDTSLPGSSASTPPSFSPTVPESGVETEAGTVAVPGLADAAIETPAEPVLQKVMLEVKSGDSLSLLFDRAGLTPRDVYMVTKSDSETDILTRLYPGYQLAFAIDDDQTLQELEIITSALESYYFTLNDDGNYSGRHEEREPEIRLAFKEATINDSLFLSAQRGGISAAITMELAGIFGGVIDFLLDTRNGDTFNVLYETKYLDGEFIGNGAIVATQFVNQGKTFTALRYINNAGETDYYNPEGESMRKAFLRNPVDFVRISSGFNPNRRHPILNTIRAHKGTDYAAPNGTPVVATANGRVTWAAPNGSFGNLVVVKHNDRFETKYAHLSRYANGIRNGSRVRQGQVIGYVGATGGATGPHLHYEFLMDGVHRNPRTIHNSLPKAESIAEAEISRFRQQTQQVLAQLSDYIDLSTLAILDTQETP